MTPTTAAGRALEQRLAYDRDPAHYEPGDFFIDDRRDILAIKAEVRAAPLDEERLARALRGRDFQEAWHFDGAEKAAAVIAREYAKDPHP